MEGMKVSRTSLTATLPAEMWALALGRGRSLELGVRGLMVKCPGENFQLHIALGPVSFTLGQVSRKNSGLGLITTSQPSRQHWSQVTCPHCCLGPHGNLVLILCCSCGQFLVQITPGPNRNRPTNKVRVSKKSKSELTEKLLSFTYIKLFIPLPLEVECLRKQG